MFSVKTKEQLQLIKSVNKTNTVHSSNTINTELHIFTIHTCIGELQI